MLLPLNLESLRHLTPDEFVVVQGVADLAVVMPKEIWLVDFKTDSLEGTTASVAAKDYQVQLNLYACALSAIYKRLVTRKILHFLSVSESVELT
jgi:ATP-dependent helicase/nuclease subunit A